MNKAILTLIAALAAAHVSFAQNTYPASGNVGLGTTSPIQLLDVSGSTGSFSGTAKVNTVIEQDHTNYRGLYFGFDSSGQIGVIGSSTSSAPSNLAFWNYSGSAWFEAMRLTSGGNLGISTTSPAGRLNVIGKTGTYGGQTIIDDNGSYVPTFAQYKWIGSGSSYCQTTISNSVSAQGSMDFRLGAGTGAAIGSDAQTTRMTILPSGNVLIGKTSQSNSGYILDVAGNARMNQVVVNTTGADFVFEPTYKLMPLDELAAYLKQNHHLPGIAPASDMQINGMDVGGTETKLLQKVEELTLYLVEKDKQLDDQSLQLNEEKQKNQEQEARLKKLEAEVELLMKGQKH